MYVGCREFVSEVSTSQRRQCHHVIHDELFCAKNFQAGYYYCCCSTASTAVLVIHIVEFYRVYIYIYVYNSCSIIQKN